MGSANLEIQLPELRVGILNPDGSMSERTYAVEDPRESWCRHWNELHDDGRRAVPLAEFRSDSAGKV